MRIQSIRSVVAAAVLCFSSMAAQATVFRYTLSGDFEASFTIDDSTHWNFLGQGDTGFLWPLVHGTFGGHDLRYVLIGFPTAAEGGGIEASSYYPDPLANDLFGRDYFFSAAGDTLFTGSIDDPHLKTGSYDFVEFYEPGKSYHLEVTSVPEPVSWAMLLVGFALTGAALRQSRARPTRMSLGA